MDLTSSVSKNDSDGIPEVDNIVEPPPTTPLQSPALCPTPASTPVQTRIIIDEVETMTSYIGNTKWFNGKLGYGFVTICDGDHKDEDIFVHHTAIKPLHSQFRTLTRGEYVQLNIIKNENQTSIQAANVTGILGGPLMCDNDIFRGDGQGHLHAGQAQGGRHRAFVPPMHQNVIPYINQK
jgi:cold shock CspA family protein